MILFAVSFRFPFSLFFFSFELPSRGNFQTGMNPATIGSVTSSGMFDGTIAPGTSSIGMKPCAITKSRSTTSPWPHLVKFPWQHLGRRGQIRPLASFVRRFSGRTKKRNDRKSFDRHLFSCSCRWSCGPRAFRRSSAFVGNDDKPVSFSRRNVDKLSRLGHGVRKNRSDHGREQRTRSRNGETPRQPGRECRRRAPPRRRTSWGRF